MSRRAKIKFLIKKTVKKMSKEQSFRRPILSDAHEHTNKFSSATGETFTKTKRMDQESNFYLANNKGIAVVFSPFTGTLHPHSEIPITVTVYNNACGNFDDVFSSDIKGLDGFSFPINIKISGSPIVIPDNQVGLNYNKTPPCISFPTVVEQAPQQAKTFKIKNTGIADVSISWKIYDDRDRVNSTEDIFDIKIVKNNAFDNKDQPYKLDFNFNEPEDSLGSAYEIEPRECIIPSKEGKEFKIKFNSDQGVEQFNSILMAHP